MNKTPKTYDCTQVFNELDLLEIRMNILDPYVDFFVISESRLTFSEKPKPLYYEENKERFKKWKHKIIHHIADDIKSDNIFERTGHQKDSIRKDLKGCNPNDIIYYGDVDEIWNPQEIGEGLYKLRQLNYSYYLNMRSSEEWRGTSVCLYKNLPNLNDLRANHDNVLDNGGWHFTNMGGIDQILKKLDSYDHQEMNTEEIRSRLKERMENGEDYVGRRRDWRGKEFNFWIDEVDLPKFILDNKEKYSHLWKK